MDAGIAKSKVLVRAQVIAKGLLVTQTAIPTNSGRTFSTATNLDLSSVPHDAEVPTNSPIMIDYTYNFHVSVATIHSSETTLLDVLPDDGLVVAAIQGSESINNAIVPFPAMQDSPQAGLREGFGDGRLDGSGVIATVGDRGQLLVANSQSGGYTYPDAVHLNYDMQSVFAFRLQSATLVALNQIQSAWRTRLSNPVRMEARFPQSYGWMCGTCRFQNQSSPMQLTAISFELQFIARDGFFMDKQRSNSILQTFL